jgi:hypothetical protein
MNMPSSPSVDGGAGRGGRRQGEAKAGARNRAELAARYVARL